MDYSTMVKASRECNHTYDGKFYLAVKSTGIFCLPSCKAKFPLEKNIEFFLTKEEAIDSGYRGCLRCHSLEYPNTEPSWLIDLVEFIENNLSNKLVLRDFERTSNKPINTIRRHFQKHYEMTPSQYHRAKQLELAKEKIESGEDYRDAAFSTGFESLSGFREAFENKYGLKPGEIKI